MVGGRPYLVGERGPELLIPGGSGTVIPNNQLGTSGLMVGTLNVFANDVPELYDQLERERRRRSR